MSGKGRCTVEHTARQVIEKKILDSLSEGDKVAILATKEDLELFLVALESYQGSAHLEERCSAFAEDVKQLLREAFP